MNRRFLFTLILLYTMMLSASVDSTRVYRDRLRMASQWFLSTEHELDRETGYTDRHARWYDEDALRFIQVDPLAHKFPWQSPYIAMDNNPIVKNDPTGMSAEWVQHDGKTEYDSRVNTQEDATKLYGDKAKYIAPNSKEATYTASDKSTIVLGQNGNFTQDGVAKTSPDVAPATPPQQDQGIGIKPFVSPSLILLGQPINYLKPVGALGSKPGSSIASYTLSKAFPQKFTEIAGKKIGTKIASTVGTNVVGRFAGRMVPYIGWGLLAKDAYDYRVEIKDFIIDMQKTNEANKNNLLWHVR